MEMQAYGDAGTGVANNELMDFATGRAKPGKPDREYAAIAHAIRREVQLADYRMAGAAALAARGGQLACTLIDVQRQMCGDDPEKLMATQRFIGPGIDRLAAIANPRPANPWGI